MSGERERERGLGEEKEKEIINNTERRPEEERGNFFQREGGQQGENETIWVILLNLLFLLIMKQYIHTYIYP